MSGAHAEGNYAPVQHEITAVDLPVTGAVPAELSGVYLRNGPNPRSPAQHWFTGDGMIHGVRLSGGRAQWYRNRWVRTRTFTEGAQVYRPDGSRDLTAGVANTHVVRHAGRTFALVESSLPVEITTGLDTVGPYDFGGRLTDSMTAHPKICPATGELHFFGYGSMRPPYVTYHRADAAGTLVLSRPVDVPGVTMMHDFHLTADHVVLMDLPVVFDVALSRGGMPYRWSDTYGARLGVLRRDDPYGPVRWFDIDPCYVFHGLNAYDQGERIILHVVRYPHLWRGDGTPAATLWRWTVDLRAGTVGEEQLDDRDCEFPRIDDRLAGRDARHGFVTCARPAGEVSAVVRYDLHAGTSVSHRFDRGRIPAEASFVPRAGGGGWLLTYVYDAASARSDLVVLDTDDLGGKPAAVVELPGRVPFGFHGNWFADPAGAAPAPPAADPG